MGALHYAPPPQPRFEPYRIEPYPPLPWWVVHPMLAAMAYGLPIVLSLWLVTRF